MMMSSFYGSPTAAGPQKALPFPPLWAALIEIIISDHFVINLVPSLNASVISFTVLQLNK